MGEHIVATSRQFCRILDVLAQQAHSNHKMQTWISDQQIRFNLWASQLGTFSRGSQSIRHRLRKNYSVRQTLVQLLDALLQNLRSLAEDWAKNNRYLTVADGSDLSSILSPYEAPSDGQDWAEDSSEDDEEPQNAMDIEIPSDDEMDDSSTPSDTGTATPESQISAWMNRIEEDMDDLLRIAYLVRQHSALKGRRKADEYEPPSDDSADDADEEDEWAMVGAKTSLSDKFRSYAHKVVDRELGPQRSQEVASLRSRLEEAMLKRWRRICYRHNRAARIKKQAQKPRYLSPGLSDFSDLRAPEEANIPADTQPTDVNAAAFNSSTEQKPRAYDLAAAPASTLSAGFSLSQQVYRDRSQSKPSSRVGEAKLELPRFPELWASPNIYDCPYCDQFPVIREPSKSAWRNHLWHDLNPFVCLYEGCLSPEKEFATAYAWSEHMSSMHREFSWKCPHCDESEAYFDSESDFKSHFSGLHKSTLTESELDMIADVSKSEIQLDSCPICGLAEGMIASEAAARSLDKQKDLTRCIVRHFESLALHSLPWHFGVEEESEDELDSIKAEADMDEGQVEPMEDQEEPNIVEDVDEDMESSTLGIQPRESPWC